MIVITAISIDDVRHVFDFISAFGVTLLMYILPAVFFLSTSTKFGKKSARNAFETTMYEFISYFMIVFGVFMLILGLRVCYFNLMQV